MLMKNVTRTAKCLLGMMMLLFGTHAYAQESIKVEGADIVVANVQTVQAEDVSGVAYSGLTADFDTTAVNTALGIDSIAMAAAYIVNPSTWEAVENTTDGWRNGAGDACGWGEITEETRGYCVKISVPSSGQIDYLGAHPNGVWNEGDTFTAYWGFVANEKASLVKVEVTFAPGTPEVELPTPETVIANLQLVGEAAVSHERYYTQGYDASPVAVVIPTLAEQLGIEKEALAQAFANMVYIEQRDAEGYASGTLDLLSVTDGWTYKAWDKETNEETNDLIGGTYGQGCQVYLQQMAYAAGSDSVSFVMGQMPSIMAKDESRQAKLYVVYGQKAFVINYSVKFVEPAYNGVESMTKVGEQTITLEQQPTGDYSAVSFTLDLDQIVTLLGAPSDSNVQMNGLMDNGGLSADHTANNGGWWLTATGAVTGYGNNSAFYIEPIENNVWRTFNVGQFPNLAKGGETYTAKLYLIYGENYYELTVNLNITEKEQEDFSALHVVAERTLNINQLPNNDYVWSESVQIPDELLIETIGTAAPTLLGLAKESTEENPIYSKEYSCDPKPGFWLTAEGKVTTWGDSSHWGMSIVYEQPDDALAINCIQFPGLSQVGSSYAGTFFLANPEDGAMLKVNLHYNIVESLEDFETVGIDTLVVKVSGEEAVAQINLAQVAEMLGYESEEALMVDDYALRALTANGVYADGVKATNGIMIDEEGFCVAEGTMGICFDAGQLFVYNNGEEPTQWKANVELCFEKDGKRYLIHLVLASADIYEEVVGVKATYAPQQTGRIYDLQGREVKAVQKGIYVKNGMKYLK